MRAVLTWLTEGGVGGVIERSLLLSCLSVHHTETKEEMGRTYSKNEGQEVDQTLHSGNQREGKDQEDDHSEDGKTT